MRIEIKYAKCGFWLKISFNMSVSSHFLIYRLFSDSNEVLVFLFTLYCFSSSIWNSVCQSSWQRLCLYTQPFLNFLEMKLLFCNFISGNLRRLIVFCETSFRVSWKHLFFINTSIRYLSSQMFCCSLTSRSANWHLQNNYMS